MAGIKRINKAERRKLHIQRNQCAYDIRKIQKGEGEITPEELQAKYVLDRQIRKLDYQLEKIERRRIW